jgi:hypothetical protein
MDKIIKEELNRVKSLMFLQESIINENLSAEAGGLAKIIKQGGAEAKVLEKELEAILPTIKGGLGAKGVQLKTIEDLLFAIKSDSLSLADMGALNFNLLRRGKLKPNLLDANIFFIASNVSLLAFSKILSISASLISLPISWACCLICSLGLSNND